MERQGGDVTALLKQWAGGDEAALSEVAGAVQQELRKIADGYLRRERAGHTLQPTALVNEAWIRLVRQEDADFDNRRHFFALAAQIMRQILVDHARAAKSAKRGGGMTPVELKDSAGALDPSNAENFLMLHDALDKLAARHPRHARILELRYFGGLGVNDVADLLEISIATVSRDQKFAEALLSQMMSAKNSAADSARQK
ncbi:MAG: sigma-70 family RNA polymerase sigma factor [Bryobacterales bacterium]|nr:sigma-70 family RNA polymerase sigma factor [Bryobacterales bacterium]